VAVLRGIGLVFDWTGVFLDTPWGIA